MAKKTVTVTYTVKVEEGRTKKQIVDAAKAEAIYVAESLAGNPDTKAKVAVTIE